MLFDDNGRMMNYLTLGAKALTAADFFIITGRRLTNSFSITGTFHQEATPI